MKLPDELPTIGAGWTDEQWAEHDAHIAAERQAGLARGWRAHDMRAGMHRGGFPLRAIDAAMAPTDTAAMRVLASHAWDARPIVVLAGKVGCGKTVAATAHFLGLGGAVFIRATEFAAASRYDAEARKRLASARGVLLDDLGQEFNDAKGSFLTDLQELVDVCYGDYKPLIITTNLEAKEFAARVGNRIVDRIRECGAFLVVEGETLRRKAP